MSSLLKKPFDPKDGLVVQYEATLQDGLECGGAYLKFLNTDEKAFTPDTLDGDSPYTLMFGPDRCGGTDKVHVIVRHAAPSGAVEEKHLASPPRMPNDKFPHLYGLAITAAGDVTVKIDGEAVFEGSLFDQGVFEPPFNPPAEIDDEADEKPDTWIDDPQMDDPDATKPEDWDERATIPDETDEKPEGYDDTPETIADPTATKPSDWGDEDDGEWEAPTIKNPEFKGPWRQKQIDNPDFKGIWTAPDIPNPEYTADDTLYKFDDLRYVGFELWQVTAGSVFDNVLVTDDAEYARASAEIFLKNSKHAERKMFEEVKAKKKEEDDLEAKRLQEEAEASGEGDDFGDYDDSERDTLRDEL